MLATLARRYASGDIYTQTGPSIVIAVNPFRKLPGLYDAAAMEAYRSDADGAVAGTSPGGGVGSGGGSGAPPPHVFKVASDAYWRMRREARGQALLVSNKGRSERARQAVGCWAALPWRCMRPPEPCRTLHASVPPPAPSPPPLMLPCPVPIPTR